MRLGRRSHPQMAFSAYTTRTEYIQASTCRICYHIFSQGRPPAINNMEFLSQFWPCQMYSQAFWIFQNHQFWFHHCALKEYFWVWDPDEVCFLSECDLGPLPIDKTNQVSMTNLFFSHSLQLLLFFFRGHHSMHTLL